MRNEYNLQLHTVSNVCFEDGFKPMRRWIGKCNLLTTIYMSRLQEPGIAVPSNAQLHAALSRNPVIIKKMLNQWNVSSFDDCKVLIKS